MLYEHSNNKSLKAKVLLNIYYKSINVCYFKTLGHKLFSTKKYKYVCHVNFFIKFVDLINQNRNMLIVRKSNKITVDKFFSLSKYIYLKDKNYFLNCGKYQSGLIHRIDKLSTGMLIIGKNLTFIKRTQKCFHKRAIFKRYNTLCNKSIFYTFKTFINNSIIPLIRITGDSYRICFSKYYRIALSNNISYALVDIITGRKHQIRRHMKNIGSPIVNDTIYNSHKRHFFLNKNLIYNIIYRYNNAFLHAEQLSFYCMYYNKLTLKKAKKLDGFTNVLGLL